MGRTVSNLFQKGLASLVATLMFVTGFAAPAHAFQLFATTPSGQTITLEVEPADSVEAVRAKIQDKTTIAPTAQSISFEGIELQDGQTLADYGIARDDAIYISLVGTPQPMNSFTPADNSSFVDVGASLSMVFDRPVTGVAGKEIRIVKTPPQLIVFSSTLDIIRIDAGSNQVSGSGTNTITFTPESPLALNTDYHIEIDAGAFLDTDGNSFTGLSSQTTWNFQTAKVPRSGLTVALDASMASSYSGTGSTWTDLSGAGNDVTLMNSPTFNAGVGSFTFATSGQKYGAFQTTNLLNQSAYTKLVWFKPDNFNDTNNLFSSGNNEAHAFWADGAMQGCTARGDNLASVHNGLWPTAIYAPQCLSAQWQLGAVSFSNQTGWKLYSNGELVATRDDTEEIDLDRFGGYTTFIGRYGNFGSYFFNGEVAQVYLYDRALADDEVREIFTASAEQFLLTSFSLTLNPQGGSVFPSNFVVNSLGDKVVLPTPTSGSSVFLGWYDAATGGTRIAGGGDAYQPTADTTLFAQWEVRYSVSFDAGTNATVTPSTAIYIPGQAAIDLPLPERDDFVFLGWFDAATDGQLVGSAGDQLTPTEDTTLFAQWQQASLAGIDPADLIELGSATMLPGLGADLGFNTSFGRVAVTIPADALPTGTQVKIYSVANNQRASSVITEESAFLFSLVLAWRAPDQTVPDALVPLEMTITSSEIASGDRVYSVVGDTAVLLATATENGRVEIQISADPLIALVDATPAPRVSQPTKEPEVPQVQETENELPFGASIRRKGEDVAKVYFFQPVNAGKIQFFLNGREIAWVNATSPSDAKLRREGEISYLVRSVDLDSGKNVIEVYVEGERVRRVAYSK